MLDPPLPTEAHVIAETPRLILRTWTAADVEPIARVWCDAATMRFAGPLAPGDVPRALRAGLRAQAAHGVCLWAVERRGAGVIGDCGFHHRPDALELAYHFDPAWWGRGLATEAARAAIGYARATWPARRVRAWVSADNRRSTALLDRLGFTCEGPDPAEGGELRFVAPEGM